MNFNARYPYCNQYDFFNFSTNPITLILNIIVGGFIGAKFINPVVNMITDEIDLPREKVAGFLILIDMIISYIIGYFILKPNMAG